MRGIDEIPALSSELHPLEELLGASYVWADYRPGSLDLLREGSKGSWLQVSSEDFVLFS